jgi:effector-binding domain-containing protein
VYANEEAEALVPLNRPVPGSERVLVYELPAAQVAAVVHSGPFENFAQEHSAVLRWIEANGYRITGPYRELYLWHDPLDMGNAATEVQYPVQK